VEERERQQIFKVGGLGTEGSIEWDWEGERDSRDGRMMRWVLKMAVEGELF